MLGKVTVLYITDMFNGKGGAEKNLLQLVRGIDRSRYVPLVLCLHYGKLLSEIRAGNIFCRELRLERVYGIRGLVEALKLVGFIRRNKVQIVVTYHEASDFWGGVIARLSGVPVVISNRRDMGYRLKPRHIFLYRIINRVFDRIIVVSEAVRSAVAGRQNGLWHKLVTVYNGVEGDVCPLAADGAARLKESLGLVHPEWLVVGTTGSIRPIKGHMFLIEAAAEVVKEFPGTYFIIVGSVDDTAYVQQLREAARARGIVEHIIFCGHRKDIIQVVQIMDVCANPSLSEGMSNAILEYMACGRPVVATRAGGNPEVVRDGETGYLVPSGDAAALAKSLSDLLRNPALRQRMGAEGRRVVEKKFSVTAMLQKIEGLYAGLLKERWLRGGIVRHDRGLVRRMVSSSVKETVGTLMHYSGIALLLRATGGGTGIRVLAYHRIANEPFDPLSMCMSPGLFEENIRHIRKRYAPLSLEEAVYLLRGNKRIPANAVVVTFDDGYEDNYSIAFPILAGYKIPAAIFLNVGAVERSELIWYDRLVEAFRSTRCRRVDLGFIGMGEYRLSSFRQRAAVCRRMVAFCKEMDNVYRVDAVEQIIRALGMENGDAPGVMLDWDKVRYLASAGVTIGSHAVNHFSLRTLDLADLEFELRESKRLIRERCGTDPVFFANPFGDPHDLSPGVIALLRSSGYAAVFTLERGINRDASAFVLRRYCMSPGMVCGATGIYSTRVFDVQMSLWRASARKAPLGAVEPVV